MLDINLIRREPELVRELLARKGWQVDFTDLLANDQRRRNMMHENETLKAERNRVSSEIPKLKKQGADTTEIFENMRQLGDQIKANDEVIDKLQQEQTTFIASLPNLPAEDVIAGGKENNQVIHTHGEKPQFDFTPKNHVELAESLNLVDFVRGVKLSGSGFWLYKGLGAQLEWAMINYFISEHIKDKYQMIMPPHLLNYESGFTAGQFPKFEEDVFTLQQRRGMGSAEQIAKEKERDEEAMAQHGFKHFLGPTAETALVNMHRDEILDAEQLPLKYFAYTPCYRSEAGSYRAEERGTIRGHQFNKVEIFQYTLPELADEALQEMINKAEKLVQGLELHYRLSKLAAEDCSHSMRKTLDIEVWIPSINEYKEVSSASWAGDYQARRGNIRYRRPDGKKSEYAHTLNASGLATSRILPALLEQHQQADGSVYVPKVLRPYLNGLEYIKTE